MNDSHISVRHTFRFLVDLAFHCILGIFTTILYISWVLLNFESCVVRTLGLTIFTRKPSLKFCKHILLCLQSKFFYSLAMKNHTKLNHDTSTMFHFYRKWQQQKWVFSLKHCMRSAVAHIIYIQKKCGYWMVTAHWMATLTWKMVFEKLRFHCLQNLLVRTHCIL